MLIRLRHTHPRGDAQSGITLVELIIAMSIMGILSAMILMVWFSLQSSYASSVQNAKQRDVARQGVWRMATEIRDAQGIDGYPPVMSAGANSILIGTSFNNSGNTEQPTDASSPDLNVHRVKFSYLKADNTIYRTEDANGDGTFAGEGETSVALVRNVVNGTVPAGRSTPLFRYSYYDTSGVLQTVDSLTDASIDPARLLNVQIQALVDIKPNKSPTYMDLRTTVQPRNAARH
jgi:prepilin-type N-terminal cleavage/methylation domain-containing protein